MDKRTLTRDEALELVRRYKQVITPRFDVEPKVMMFGSYSKGYANPDSDIDVAVIVPTYGDRKFEISKKLWHDVDEAAVVEISLNTTPRTLHLYLLSVDILNCSSFSVSLNCSLVATL